jgi:hypothetical protein
MVRGLIAAPMVAAAVSFEIVVPKVPALDGVSFVIASSPVVAPPFPAAHLVAPFQAQPWLRSRAVRLFREKLPQASGPNPSDNVSFPPAFRMTAGVRIEPGRVFSARHRARSRFFTSQFMAASLSYRP